MSRSMPEGDKPVNPAKMFLEFNGASGIFEYYDKNAVNPDPNKKGARVAIGAPFMFFVLDQLSTITGYNDQSGSGIWANEIRGRALKTDPFVVFTKNGEQARGLYDNIKGKVSGMDYCKSVYIAFFGADKQLAIGNIKMSGACLNAWIEFSKTADTSKGYVKFVGASDHKKGVVNYKMPIFEAHTIPADKEAVTEAKVIALDVQLQEYLKSYFDFYKNAEAEVKAVVEEFKANPVQEQNNVQQSRSVAKQPVQDEFGAPPVTQVQTIANPQGLGPQNDFLSMEDDSDLPF